LPSILTSLREFLRFVREMQRIQTEELGALRRGVEALEARLAAGPDEAGRRERNAARRRGAHAAAEFSIDALAALSPRYRDPRCLNHVAGQVFSQNNEDGILAEIFARIGAGDRTFVEIAAGDGIENNTRLLLQLGWTGLWVEGGAREAASIRDNLAAEIEAGRLRFVEALVDAEGVADLVAANGPAGPDLLSLDIDYNTSHVWTALAGLKPRVVCIEYNAHYPAGVDWEVPYRTDGAWHGTTRFGASLKALERIGRAQGYSLVGCDIFGVNAFFVRNDLCDERRFLAPFTAEQHYEPPRYDWVHMRGHARHAPGDPSAG
jgi:hypothetical protein